MFNGTLDKDQKAGRKPIGKNDKGQYLYMGGDGTCGPAQPKKFQNGGSVNVIPTGSLHARLNHMEGAGEDFTKKGIPVVDMEGNQ